ncbi:MAG: alpha/beta hydrolase-fold protein, partial [Thermoanaerobaculia bacterium]
MLLALVAAMTIANGEFLERSVTVDQVAHVYRVWIPPDYTTSRRWPAVLFLHGSGERGSDGLKPTQVGLGPALLAGVAGAGAIVVFPQCPENEHWVGPARNIAMAALDAVEKEFSIDRRRVALTGISMGGAGAWVLAAEHPDRWSAAAPICGWVVRPRKLTSIPDNKLPWLG